MALFAVDVFWRGIGGPAGAAVPSEACAQMNNRQYFEYQQRQAEWHILQAEHKIAELWRGKTLNMSSAHEMLRQRPTLEQVRRLRRRVDEWQAQMDEQRQKTIQGHRQSRAKSRHKELTQEIADDRLEDR